MNYRNQLINLYSNQSKHSNYQVLPTKLRDILNDGDIRTSSRFEKERLDYIVSAVNVSEKTVLDIGANTGYFSFELLDAGAKSVHCYEGNKEHASFIKVGARALGVDNNLTVTDSYYEFDGSDKDHYDVGLLFNVLHHIGDDYGDNSIAVDKAKEAIIQQLNNMSSVADTLIFQLGFNWQGDSTKPLFANGSKAELIDFIRDGISEYWDIVSIAVAEGAKDSACYNEVNNTNIERNDSLGEFLNRPIFILKSNRKYDEAS